MEIEHLDVHPMFSGFGFYLDGLLVAAAWDGAFQMRHHVGGHWIYQPVDDALLDDPELLVPLIRRRIAALSQVPEPHSTEQQGTAPVLHSRHVVVSRQVPLVPWRVPLVGAWRHVHADRASALPSSARTSHSYAMRLGRMGFHGAALRSGLCPRFGRGLSMRLGARSVSAVLGAFALTIAMSTCSGRGVQPIAHEVQHPAPVQPTTAATNTATGLPIGRQRIGTSVQHRPIFAYQIGSPAASMRAVVVGNVHGDEPAGVQLTRAIITGPPVLGVDLWVVPTMNPDGLAANSRQNARGVDLNRNWGYKWVHQTGGYNSGPHPFSEPETRAMQRFLNRIDPSFVVSFHQPLHGVDSDNVKSQYLMHRLSVNLNLPTKPFTCGTDSCHGTMSGWFNRFHAGAAITVEFGSAPTRSYLTGRAASGTVRAVLGHT